MPSWLKLALFALGCTLVVPLWVLGMSGGNWRQALQAWRFFALLLAGLAVPGMVVWIWITLAT